MYVMVDQLFKVDDNHDIEPSVNGCRVISFLLTKSRTDILISIELI